MESVSLLPVPAISCSFEMSLRDGRSRGWFIPAKSTGRSSTEQWYRLRPWPGMALGALSYVAFRAGFHPHAPATAVFPAGVATLAIAAGFASRRVEARIQQVFASMFTPLLAEPALPAEGDTIASTAHDETSAPRSLRDAARERDLAQAHSILRGTEAPAREIYDLAERLKNANEFGYARKLYGRIRGKGDYSRLSKTPARVGPRHALCTYKDPDFPAADRFKRALEILDEVDLLGLSDTDRQESLGLRGAVWMRIWQVEGQPADLDRALGTTSRGTGWARKGIRGTRGSTPRSSSISRLGSMLSRPRRREPTGRR